MKKPSSKTYFFNTSKLSCEAKFGSKQFMICLKNNMIIRNPRRYFLDEINGRFSPLLRFYLLVILSCTSVFAAKPFTFDPVTRQIYNLPDSFNVPAKTPYAVACPSQNESEDYVNEEESMDHKALFVQKYNYVEESSSDYQRCAENFEMAAVFSHENHAIEFGYEIYYRKKTAMKKVYRSDYDEYGPVSEARSTWKRIVNMTQRPMYPSLGSASDKALRFTWIPRITLRYSISKWSFIGTKYTLYRNVAKELTIECDNYDLGYRFYKMKHGDIDQFYLPGNQKEIFSRMKLPELPEDSVCKTTGECVRKYDFLKAYHFRSSYRSPVSCSDLTTIPIWYEVAEELLNNLEIFLFALGQVTQNPLTIFPGVYNTLSFMTKDTRNLESMPVYLYTKQKRIPVPEILYKIVRYKTHDCKEKVELCWFDIVIVIHNHPGPVKKRMICPKDKCREYGWDKIKFVNRPKKGEGSEHIYCCKLDTILQGKLQYKVGEVLRDDWNLKDFPVYDEEQGENRYVDRQDEVETQMSKLQIEILKIPTANEIEIGQ